MVNQKIHFYSSILLVLCFILSIRLSYEWEQKLIIKPIGMDISRAQSSGKHGRNKSASQRLWFKDNVYNARYKFLNFNSDTLHIYFGMNRGDYRKYLKNYGYSDTFISLRYRWCRYYNGCNGVPKKDR